MMWRRGEQADPSGDFPRPGQEARDMVENEFTVVGQGARLEGTVVSAGSLRVDGSVKGQINADGDVILSPQSQVEADIRAENVTVAGRFIGNIVVKGRAELARGGRVDGDVTSKVLVIQDGAVFSGQSIMDQHGPQAQAQAQPGQRAQAQRPETTEPQGSAPQPRTHQGPGQGARPTPDQARVP
jgi:cytoskeletal protein CcmA (bactofilin family)